MARLLVVGAESSLHGLLSCGLQQSFTPLGAMRASPWARGTRPQSGSPTTAPIPLDVEANLGAANVAMIDLSAVMLSDMYMDAVYQSFHTGIGSNLRERST